MTNHPIEPQQRELLLVDVIGFSLLADEAQYWCALAIRDGAAEAWELFSGGRGEGLDALIPTGDGFYLVMSEGVVGVAPFFALALRNLLLYRDMQVDGLFDGVRAAAHRGMVVPLEVGGGRNFVGGGMNDCARLLTLLAATAAAGERFAGDGSWVFCSREAWAVVEAGRWRGPVLNGLRSSPEYRFADRHGRVHFGRFLEIERAWVVGG